MAKEAVIKLQDPIQFGSETITEITIQPLKAKHIRGMKLDQIGSDEMLTLIGKLAAMPDIQVDELTIADIMKASEVIEGMMGESQGTGSIA